MNFHAALLAVALTTTGTFTRAQNSDSEFPAIAQEGLLLARSDKVLNLPLLDEVDKLLGELGDILVDARTGELRYAVLEVGGFLGIGEDQRVVPWSFIQIESDLRDVEKYHARTNLTEAQIRAAPKSKRGQRYDAELDRRIEATFGADDAWVYAGAGQPEFAWLSQMTGVPVANEGGEAGTIRALVLAPRNGCTAYLVLETTAQVGGHPIAVPWSKVELAYDRNDQLFAATALDAERLAGAPSYEAKDWKRMASAPWVIELTRYFGGEPFWKTSRFALQRPLPARRP